MNRDKEYKNLVTRLGIALIFFLILFPSLTGTVGYLGDLLTDFFPRSDAAFIVSDLSYSFSYLLAFILPVPLFYLISKGTKSHPMMLKLTLPEPHPLLSYVAIIFAGLAIILPMATLNAMLFPVTFDSAEMFSLDFSKPYRVVLAFISTAVVPAFCEEFLFRGLVASNLKPYGKGTAIIVSAVAFGLVHQNPLQLLYATVAGIVFGFVYLETESIWCCIAIHFVNNFTSVLQSYSAWRYGDYTVTVGFFIFSVAICAAGLVCAIFLLSHRKDQKRVSTGQGFFGSFDGVRSGRDVKGSLAVVVKNPAMIIFVVACVVECVWVGVGMWVSAFGG